MGPPSFGPLPQTCGTPNKAGNQNPAFIPQEAVTRGLNRTGYLYLVPGISFTNAVLLHRRLGRDPRRKEKEKNKSKQNSQCERVSVWQLQMRQRRKDDKANTSRQRVCARECARFVFKAPVLFILPVRVWKKAQFSRRRHRSAGGGGSAEVPGEARCHTSRFWLINTD